MKRRVTALLFTIGLLAGFCVAQAAEDATVHADFWNPVLTLDGNYLHKNFTNEKGEEVCLFSYQGTGYLSLRSAGELMGKAVSWDGATNTVSISGTSGAKTEVTDPLSAAERYLLKREGMDIELRPDITVLVDGEKQTFANVVGEPVFPAVWNGSLYLPIRSAGELMGKQVKWRVDENGYQFVYLYTPLPEAEYRSLGEFLDKALPKVKELTSLCKGVWSDVHESKDLKAGEEKLCRAADVLEELHALPAPETDFAGERYDLYRRSLEEYYPIIKSGAEQLDKGADLLEVMEADDGALKSAVGRVHQFLDPIVSSMQRAYDAMGQ